MASCPYCKRDGIDERGLVPHIRMSDDDAHAAQGELPEDAEERLNANTDDVEFVTFEDADVDDEPDSSGESGGSCVACGGDLHELETGEPIEVEGEVVGYADPEDDFICVQCGEIHVDD